MPRMNRAAPALTRVLLALALTLAAAYAPAQNINSSLLLLVDASGSMGDPVGANNPQAKMDAAKEAAIAALGRAAGSGSVEVAVLAFSGDCADPVPRHQDFTTDVDRLTAFIASLQPGGGTPMADALLFANRFMAATAAREAEARRAAIVASVPEMAVIPAGAFRMGCVSGRHFESNETPIREVRVNSFELSKQEVTLKQWDACVEYGGCRWVGDEGWGRNDRPVIHAT